MKAYKKFGKLGAALALVVGAATAGVGIASSAMAQTGTPPAQSGEQQVAPQQDAPFGRGGLRGGGGPREGGLRGGQAITTTGTIAEYTINPMGDYDGFTLADKTEVNVPPPDAVKVKDLFAVGSAVTVVGYQHPGRPDASGNASATEIQAKTITSGSASYTAEKPATPPTPAAREVVTQTSTIASLSLNEMGDLDGFTLADKSLVRVPPHESDALKDKLTVGAAVEVSGDKRVGTSGLTVIRAESLKVNGETVRHLGPDRYPSGEPQGQRRDGLHRTGRSRPWWSARRARTRRRDAAWRAARTRRARRPAPGQQQQRAGDTVVICRIAPKSKFRPGVRRGGTSILANTRYTTHTP